MNRIKLIQLNNKKIIFCDLKGIARDEILHVSSQILAMFKSEVKNNEKASFLVDITGVEIPPSTMEEITSLMEIYKQNIFKEGVIGLSGMRKTLFNLYGLLTRTNLKAFENRELAMNWLAS